MGNAESRTYLAQQPVRNLASRDIVKLTSADTLENILEVFRDFRIQCVPIEAFGTCRGLVDVRDVVRVMFGSPDARLALRDEPPTIFGIAADACINAAQDDWMLKLPADTPLLDAVQKMYSAKLHRVWIRDAAAASDDHVGHVLSQPDVFEFLNRPGVLDKVTADADRPLSHFGNLGLRAVITVPHTVEAADAFRVISDSGVTGLAVVNKETGGFLANISASRLSVISHTNVSDLFLPVLDFLKRYDHASTYVTVTRDTPLRQVIALFSHHHLQRLFIVDPAVHNRPIGVLTLDDLLEVYLYGVKH